MKRQKEAKEIRGVKWDGGSNLSNCWREVIDPAARQDAKESYIGGPIQVDSRAMSPL
jgi:hypothetical protein